MSAYLTNRRPSNSTDWCVGNPNFNDAVVEPSGTFKQVGWTAGQQPPAVVFNWLFNLMHRWIKNFDERVPKVAIHNWTVNDAVGRTTDRDFSSLQDALAASNVFAHDTILVASTPSLTEGFTISKQCKIVFLYEGYMYGNAWDSNVKITIDAPDVHIVGGGFWGFSQHVFVLTENAKNCTFTGVNFGDNANPINDDAVPPGYTPVVTGCRNYLF